MAELRKETSFLTFSCESFGVSAKLGPGALLGSHPARFREVSRFPERVRSMKVPESSEVPRKGSKQRFWKVPRF